MAYGTQVNINGNDMVSIIDPTVYIDVISTPASGSRSYTLTSGYSLQYVCGVNNGNSQPTITISGNTITWSGVSASAMLWVFQGRV